MSKDELKKMGEELRDMREAANWARNDAAEHAGIARSTLHNIESGKQKGGDETVIRLQKLYAECAPPAPAPVITGGIVGRQLSEIEIIQEDQG